MTHPISLSPELETIGKSILLRFEEVVETYPDNVAAHDGRSALTYRQLNDGANRLANALLAAGGPAAQTPIAVLLGHETSAILALMGILKAGHPFVVLSPTAATRITASVLADSGAACLVTSRRFESKVDELKGQSPWTALYLEDLDSGAPARNPGLYPGPQGAFAIYYTSASTGDAKGVLLTHAFIRDQMVFQIPKFGFGPNDGIALIVSLGFQHTSTMFMQALLCGGRVCMYDLASQGPQKALEWIKSERVTTLQTSPTVLRLIFDGAPSAYRCPDMRLLLLGAEVVSAGDLALFFEHAGKNCACYVMYGSTEAGLVTIFRWRPETNGADEYPPVGYPVPGIEILLLDADGQAVTAGDEGEIVVRRRGRPSQYWRRPDLTESRFVAAPGEPELTLFHTGDLGRFRADGALEFRGRKDTQVKIRGMRVEPSEIESALGRHPDVAQAFAAARPSRHRPDQLQLVAYVVLKPGHSSTTGDLLQYARSSLPAHAVPAFIVPIDRLPMTASGKVDRRALPEPPERAALEPEELPEGEVEAALVDIWSRVLGTDRVGVNDDFFEVGGDSLLMVSMTLEVEKVLERTVPDSFFDHPTLRNLARTLRPESASDSPPPAPIGTDAQPPAKPESQFLRPMTSARNLRRALSGQGTGPPGWVLARLVRGRSFAAAQRLIYGIVEQELLCRLLFGQQRRLFRRFLQGLDLHPADAAGRLRLNLLNNLLFRLVEAKEPFNEPASANAGGPTRLPAFFVERRRLLEDTPIDQLNDFFPVDGLPFLQAAIQSERGVILLSMHGTAGANRVALGVLGRRLELVPIETISQKTPFREGRHSSRERNELAPAREASIYAEVALRAQRLLEQGRVIHVSADFGARAPGRKYAITVGDRSYHIKGGFAELALNSGASILPIYGRYLENGRAELYVLPPLDVPAGDRNQQILALVRQYEAFMNGLIRSQPEIFTWSRIKKHLRQPPAA